MSGTHWIPFEPVFPEGSNASSLLLDFARELEAIPEYETDRENNVAVEACRKRVLKRRIKCDASSRQAFVAAAHVLSDLVKQGWQVRVSESSTEIARPENGESDRAEARERIRGQLHAERDEQLRQPSTVAFLRSMEARQLFRDRFVSIFSLMRDGLDLSARLRALNHADENTRLDLAAGLIEPYLHFIREEDRCPWTGLRLVDIWRYFRHTWASSHKSVPGRSIMVLVRDAAAPCHPVIGIAALSSAAVAVTARDERIGWTPGKVIEEIGKRPTARLAAWLKETVDEAIDEIYKVDFLENEILTPKALKRPTIEIIMALQAEGRQQRKEHHRFMESGDYKKSEAANGLTEDHWEEQARSPLFRSKRALDLASLLSVRMVLRRFFGDTPSKNVLVQLVDDREGREAVAKVVRKAKAERVGTAIADLTVCGAIPPYNEILGGKLVAMLMVSPEAVREYRRRYGGNPSLIASSMAGRAIARPANLVFIGTTSLYGQRPSQYDRISIPCDFGEEAERALRYEYLGRTRGIGTFQFGDQTVGDLALLLAQSKRGQQINSVFGEGVNPRLRKIREGLDALGLPTDDLLNHGGPRLVYGVQLAHNMAAYLLGQEKQPKHILSLKKPRETTAQIARWWMKRWLLRRAEKDEVLDRVARHNLVHPIRHGARVELPKTDLDLVPLNGR